MGRKKMISYALFLSITEKDKMRNRMGINSYNNSRMHKNRHERLDRGGDCIKMVKMLF